MEIKSDSRTVRLFGVNIKSNQIVSIIENNLKKVTFGMEPRDIIIDPERVTELSLKKTISILKSANGFFSERNEPVLVELNTTKLKEDFESESPQLVIIGDTHGDYITTRSALNEFFFESSDNFKPKPDKYLLFVGDYVDRPPHFCKHGSFINFMYVLALKMLYPDQVTLLRGNHESFELIPCSPFDLPDELNEIYGEDGNLILDKFKIIFRQLPLMYRNDNGIFGVHGGIFKKPKTIKELQELDRNELSAVAVTTWAEPADYTTPRIGINEIYNFNYKHFKEFLSGVGSNVLVRGHTTGLVGKTIYNDRCLTLFTTQTFQRTMGDHCAGVVTAPLDLPIESTADLSFYLQTRGNWLPVKPKPYRK
jgi:hypothetical protein